jgi:hypothetical protein
MHRIILTFGMRKSASTYCFQITQDLFERHAPSYISDADYPVALRHPFVPDAAYLLTALAHTPAARLTVRKTHLGLDTPILEAIESGDCFPVFQVREPLDIAASLIDAGAREREKPLDLQREGFTSITEVQHTLPIIREDMAIARDWVTFAIKHGFPCVDFEYVTRRPCAYLNMIASRFGLVADPAEIVESYARDSSRIMEFNVGQTGRGAALANDLESLGLLDEITRFREFLSAACSSPHCHFLAYGA